MVLPPAQSGGWEAARGWIGASHALIGIQITRSQALASSIFGLRAAIPTALEISRFVRYAVGVTGLILFLLTPVWLYLWAQIDPDTFLTMVATLKRRWRAYLIKRHGQKEAEYLFEVFREEALDAGYSPLLIEAVIQDQAANIIETLGTEAANKSLGEPTPIEWFY